MVATLAISVVLSVNVWILIVQAVCLLAAFAFIVSRPNGPV
jgi:hypothetical protein